MAPHDEFLELCAVSISGELTGKSEETRGTSEGLRFLPRGIGPIQTVG